MTKREFWKAATSEQKEAIAASVDSTVGYIRQVFMYDRQTSPKKARILSAQTGGALGAHEFCPDAFSESDSLSVENVSDSAA